LDVECVSVALAVLIGLVKVLQRLGDVVLQEVAPGEVLVHSPVVLLKRKSGFVAFLSV